MTDVAFAGAAGGMTWAYDDPSNWQNSIVNYTTSTYTSGWQQGAIRRAFLASITPGAVTVVDTDRSFNHTDISVTGVGISRAVVNAAAQLMGYSGFSTTVHLDVAYQADLDLGIGDFHYMMWVKPLPNGSAQTMVHRSANTWGGIQIRILNNSAVQLLLTPINLTGTIILPANIWSHVTVTRRAGTIYMYINGVLDISVVTNATLTMPTASLRVGASLASTTPFSGSMSLLRISASGISQQAIMWIYNKEKFWFEPGIGVAFPGNDDAVLSIANDKSKQLHHIVTAWGHSVWDHGSLIASTPGTWTKVSANAGIVVKT
jgi:hypothetical protein